jgi:formate-dependent nitrite reductase membrane component NrfD
MPAHRPVQVPLRETAAARSALFAPRVQTRWDIPHATWFTLMGVGGGIFLLSRLLGLEMRLGLVLGMPLVDLASFVAIAAGGLILVADLGRPFRFVRAVARPGTSWISRGAIADFVFLVVGGLLVLPALRIGGATPFAWLPWDAAGHGVAGQAMEAAALVSAAVVIFYAGQVLADGTAIPYWRSPAVPVQFVLSSLAMSMAVVMVMETLGGEPIPAGQLWILLACLVLLGGAIVAHLRTRVTTPGKAESLQWLLRGRYRRAFLGGVLGAGTLGPAALAVVGLAWPAARDAVGVLTLACTVAAGFALRLVTLRVGIFPGLPAFDTGARDPAGR